jgi:serine/threonine-protein kinase
VTVSVMAPGARIQDFIIEGVIGRGGYAAVYRAHHAARPELVVALKVLDENHRGPVELERLQKEFAFARQLDHPHVVTVYECGRHWLAMELLSGGSVADAPSLSVRLTALEQIADALDYAHRTGVVHCDVKPSNILLSADFDRFGAKLIDFGVARSADAEPAARTTHLAGTLPYAAPHRHTTIPVDERDGTGGRTPARRPAADLPPHRVDPPRG